MVPKESKKAYPQREGLTVEGLDPNSSYSKMLELVGDAGRVLDVGCASGYLARLLSERGCQVTGIDVNPDAIRVAQEYCEKAIVGDLDAVRLPDLLPGQVFDAIMLGDVLEHLRDPWRLLDDARAMLGYEGIAVASIPNIAHGAIRLALLQGRFDYSEFGILDNTHLRFFTRRTTEELFVRSGYATERVEKTILPLFAPTNLVPELDPSEFEASTIAKVRSDPDVDTLQFVVRARALSDAAKVEQITDRYLEISAKLETASGEVMIRSAEAENARLRELLDVATADIGQLQTTIAEHNEQRQHYRTLQQREAEFQLALADISSSIEATVQELESRISVSNTELRCQRQAYDDLCLQLSAMRHAFDKEMEARSDAVSETQRTFDLVLARNSELLVIVERLGGPVFARRNALKVLLSRMSSFIRRTFVRLRA